MCESKTAINFLSVREEQKNKIPAFMGNQQTRPSYLWGSFAGILFPVINKSHCPSRGTGESLTKIK